MLYIFRPVTPDAPNRSNRNPPTKAPTIPSAMSSQKPWPCLLTILLPMNPAIRPSIIQLMMPMVAPPVKSRSSSKNPHPHNSNRWQAWPEQCVDGINRRTPHALAPRLQRDSSVPPAAEAPLLPGWRTGPSGARSRRREIPGRHDERRLSLC